MPKIRTRLRQLRAEYTVKTGEKLSQSELADLVGVDQVKISNIENNRYDKYDLELVSRILRALGKPADAWDEFFEVMEDSDTEANKWLDPRHATASLL